MASFVLIHGAWHGGWCWHKLKRELEADGHVVLAPDLPGHGYDTTAPGDVDLSRYEERVCETIDRIGPENGKIVLVGHSMGGLVISRAAELRAERISALVYLAAFIPSPGQSFATAAVAPAIFDAIQPGRDGETLCFDPDRARDAFYADCTDEDVAFAVSRLCPQPVGPTRTPVVLTPSRYGSVPRDYIECLQDRALPPPGQKEIYEQHPCREVYTLDASHSPFFSDPQGLALILARIAGGSCSG